MTPSSRIELQDVLAEAVLVGGGVAGLVDAGVDAAAQVLDERAEESAVAPGATVKAGSRVKRARARRWLLS